MVNVPIISGRIADVAADSAGAPGRNDEIEITPAMIRAGVEAFEPFLFEYYHVFDSDHPEIVRAVWTAMCKAASNDSSMKYPSSYQAFVSKAVKTYPQPSLRPPGGAREGYVNHIIPVDRVHGAGDYYWPSGRVEELRQLVGEGKSASQIAAILNVTRNSVMSKCRRLGLRLRGTKRCSS